MGNFSAPNCFGAPQRDASYIVVGGGHVQEMSSPARPLAFDRPLVLVGGGDVDPVLLRSLSRRDMAVVGVDGGADVARSFGVVPAAIVGDLDSLVDREDWPAETRILRVDEQETTDFEKALYLTSAPLTIALGMTGGRFDHTLAALDALARQAAGRRILLIDKVDLALTLDGPFSFDTVIGERVSIHPLGPVRFERSTGMRWPLGGLKLEPGVRTGTSNEAVSHAVEIVPDEDQASWLLILRRERLAQLVAALNPGYSGPTR